MTNLEIKVWLSALDVVERRIEIKYLDKRDRQTFTPRTRNVEVDLTETLLVVTIIAIAFAVFDGDKTYSNDDINSATAILTM